VRELVMKQQTAIKACLAKDFPAATLTIQVGADGKAKVLVKGKTDVPETVNKCIVAAVEKITFPAAATTVTLEVSR
jgi:hypothetical protein